MKKKQKIVAVVILAVVLLAVALKYQLRLPKSRCSNRDREIKNCVPAGKCGPTPAIDAVIDCDVKNYEKSSIPNSKVLMALEDHLRRYGNQNQTV